MVYVILVIIFLVIFYSFIKFLVTLFKNIIYSFDKNKRIESENEYVIKQKIIDENDKKYDEYLKWMQRKSNGIPMEKIKTKEEFEAEKKINDLIK